MPIVRHRAWTKRILYSLILLAVIFLGGGTVCWQVGGNLLAPAPRTVGLVPADFPAESVSIPSESGSTIAGWYAAPESSKGVVVLLHGIRSNRLSMLNRARWLYDEGYAVLLIDLQAHGESPGEFITLGYLEAYDVRAAVQYARSRSGGRPVAVLGKSLGGAAALLASPLDIDALVVESVYPTIEEATANRLGLRLGTVGAAAAPLLLCQLKPRLGISTTDLQPINHVAEIGCPVLVISGSEDRHTTLAETERLFAAAIEPKQLLILDGAAHEDLERFDAGKYKDAVIEFFKAHLDHTQ